MLSTVTPDEALKISAAAFGGLRTPAESCPLAEALGRVLAEDIESPEYVPGFDRSSVDGYAVAAADTFGCSESSPALLRLRGRVERGGAPECALAPGECAAIPTGGRLPEGADAAVMLEYSEDYGGGLIGLTKSAAPGQNVVFRGDDAAPGRAVLRAGRKLRAADIGALAAMGITEPAVRRRPLVGILGTGGVFQPLNAGVQNFTDLFHALGNFTADAVAGNQYCFHKTAPFLVSGGRAPRPPACTASGDLIFRYAGYT